jgi:hypothetical protein
LIYLQRGKNRVAVAFRPIWPKNGPYVVHLEADGVTSGVRIAVKATVENNLPSRFIDVVTRDAWSNRRDT